MSRPALRATYRLQLHGDFPLAAATALVPYLDRLGVSHVYASPVLRARRGSPHGYDVVDPTCLNPELGTEDDWHAFSAALAARGMGLVLDIVPNHLGTGSENPAWEDVLTHGRSSPWARWFDIDWDDPGPWRRGRVQVPVLGDRRARILARGDLMLAYEPSGFRMRYFDHSFPIEPGSAATILAGIEGDEPALRELTAVRASLAALPPHTVTEPERAARRHAAASEALARLRTCHEGSASVRAAVARAVASFQGMEGAPRLIALLAAQPYRLIHWRRAARELNYRRFFEVNELAAVRMEDPQVFAATHARVLAWLREGLLAGLRVDHVDGLLDPLGYLCALRDAVAQALPAPETTPFPIFVEKILAPGEALRSAWPVAGTTGYEFLNAVEALFLDPAGTAAITAWYDRELRRGTPPTHFAEAVSDAKRAVLEHGLEPDVRRLARQLARLAARDARAGTYGPSALRAALVETLVAMPVYRTYVDGRTAPDAVDRAILHEALAAARRRGQAPAGALDLLASVLLASDAPSGLRLRFVQRFQQVSGPAMAKGQEDTALYVWTPLVSRNEVGGVPDTPLDDVAGALHGANAARAHAWPGSLLCTSTHDTKRSADVRARLDVLSEVPGEWTAAVAHWRTLTARHRRRVRGRRAPDANTEYLFYQTLLGLWPVDGGVDLPAELAPRLAAYMQKATREAKVHTSWIAPDTDFEAALDAFVAGVLGDHAVRVAVAGFARQIVRPGLWNALARTLVHLTAPGTPDLYQGDELWTWSLVDPDNRRPVDFAARHALLEGVAGGTVSAGHLGQHPEDDRIKLHLIHAALALRRRIPTLFSEGTYLPLAADGQFADHVFAFGREEGRRRALTIVPRRTLILQRAAGAPAGDTPLGAAIWKDTAISVPPEVRLESLLDGRKLTCPDGTLALAEVFAVLPVALLVTP